MVRSLLARLPGGCLSGNECPARTPLGLWVLFASLLFLAAVLANPTRAGFAGPAGWTSPRARRPWRRFEPGIPSLAGCPDHHVGRRVRR